MVPMHELSDLHTGLYRRGVQYRYELTYKEQMHDYITEIQHMEKSSLFTESSPMVALLNDGADQ